ncbi:MAG: pantetheine-phosphate adenylyltransferase [Lachnospiraceae bacterium]|nr:pantetheine-phosphate adenylyltransferase [Lachnospiraceae bacterium]
MKQAIYPGSFDPVTLGHLDIIRRASRVVDHLIVAVLVNSAKSPLFSVEERVEMLRHETAHMPNVEVQSFQGLLVDYARMTGSAFIVRGLRAVTDFEYELQISQTNKMIAPEIDTVFFTTSLNYSYVSSSVVKEIASYGGAIEKMVTPYVAECVKTKIKMQMEEQSYEQH